MQRGYYAVDPAVLPAAGVQTMAEKAQSASLEAKKERLTRWHLGEQQGMLARTGLATVIGAVGPGPAIGPTAGMLAFTPRGPHPAFGPGANGATIKLDALPQQATPRRSAVRDPRMLKHAVKRTAAGMDLMVDGIRRRLQQCGLSSVADLERMFKEMDSDRSGMLSRAEFGKGLLSRKLMSTEAECDLLYDFFDEDRSGSIDWQEFVDAVRGQLSDARKAVVQEAFSFLDKTGDGVLSVDDLKLNYRCFQHPDVRNGLRSEDEVFKEILSNFDTITGDGTVTLAEFERFHENSSALISSDELFVQTVRSTWHLPGATGGKCLRVKITRGDRQGVYMKAANTTWQKDLRGTFDGAGMTMQEVVEVRPDLPMNQHDPRFHDTLMKRLGEMGYRDVTDFEVMDRQ